MRKKRVPDSRGYFGDFGGRYVPEALFPAVEELASAYDQFKEDPDFKEEIRAKLCQYAGRPTPLYFAERLTEIFGGGKVYLKREDLLHTGAHKINNTIGQVILARKMKKKRIIAETGAGQHGVATATVAALFGMDCTIYMGTEDIRRQNLNVFRMKLLGAKVQPVDSGSCTLKDSMNEAIRDWVANVSDTHYVIGSVAGPHPYPMMVRDFQSVIGEELKEQTKCSGKSVPDYLVACVGGGSNAMGLFYPYRERKNVRFIGVEAAGRGLSTSEHAAALLGGSVGILHGSKSYILQNRQGQIKLAHSVSAGLDYPGVGPEHAFYKESGRAEYVSVTDQEALDATGLLSRTEGIIPALESAHAIAYLKKFVPGTSKDEVIVVCLSGRGDKDIDIMKEHL